MYDRRYTPDGISELKENEIFVFGSNLEGSHGGGAARLAYNRFGAVWGLGTGIQGRSYAIPTMQGGVETIKPYVDAFIQFAKQNTTLTFLVTRIGCGIAGFRDEEIAPLFKDALELENVILPKEFVESLGADKPAIPDSNETVWNSADFLAAYHPLTLIRLVLRPLSLSSRKPSGRISWRPSASGWKRRRWKDYFGSLHIRA